MLASTSNRGRRMGASVSVKGYRGVTRVTGG